MGHYKNKGVRVRTICMVGGDLKCVTTLAPPIKTAFTKNAKSITGLNKKYSFDIFIYSMLLIFLPVFNMLQPV